MQDIAIAFQSELIATANVTKIEGGYLLALSIRNVMDNQAVYSKSLPCENCSAFDVVNKLKEISGVPAAPIADQTTVVETAKTPTMEPKMVRIPGKNYEIGKYDVSQGEWSAVMGNNPSKFIGCGVACPVENVSWDDVQEFIQKLNIKTGQQYRLPSDAEWVYACYGGNKTKYCGSNNPDSIAWYKDNSNETTHSVGTKQANGFGLYDMNGNVSQWMNDCSDVSCNGHLLRGGNSDDTLERLDPSISFVMGPHKGPDIGFRLARTISNKESK